MKTFGTLSLLLFYVLTAKADCLGYGTHCVWPLKTKITKSTTIVINTDNSILREAKANDKVLYLRSMVNKTNHYLTLTEVCRGGKHLIQLILKIPDNVPTEQEYELYYSKNDSMQCELQKWNDEKQDYVSMKWFIQDAIDDQAPAWIEQPKVKRKTFIQYGCGPEVQTVFHFSSSEASEVLIKATVKNRRTGKETNCYLRIRETGVFDLGHDMCSGEFKYEKERGEEVDEYEATFILIDESGNQSLPSTTVKFVQPNGKSN